MAAHADAVAVSIDVCRAADDKQASDLVLLDVSELLGLVEIFAIASVRSDRQLRAVVDAIEERVRAEHDRRPIRREGTADSGWYLVDYGDVVCHVFSEEQRGFYLLERLWSDVPRLDPTTGEPVGADDAAVR